jgi:uncharacterized coiled-coil DUF342 family protein
MPEQTGHDDLLAQRSDLSRLADELRADLREVEHALASVDHELAHLGLPMEADRSCAAQSEQQDRRPPMQEELEEGLEIQGGRAM